MLLCAMTSTARAEDQEAEEEGQPADCAGIFTGGPILDRINGAAERYGKDGQEEKGGQGVYGSLNGAERQGRGEAHGFRPSAEQHHDCSGQSCQRPGGYEPRGYRLSQPGIVFQQKRR